MNLNDWAKVVHANAVEHGWWQEDRSFGEIIALCHSELSEALEEYRKGKKPNEIYCGECNCQCEYLTEDCSRDINKRKPEGIATELADCIISILDYCGKEGIDIEEAIKIKHEYNIHRPYRHGGKKI